MSNVLNVLNRLFGAIFVNLYGQYSGITLILRVITSSPYLIIGISLVIIGFIVSILNRLIRS